MNTLKQSIASVIQTLLKIWPWTISKANTKPLVPKWSAQYQAEFDDYNILIEEGEYAGLVIRFKRLGFIPDSNDGMTVKFEYDIINAGWEPGMAPMDLTSEHCRDTIIEVLKQYLDIGE